MEYISAEEFLKQPNEVQEVFIHWWESNVSKGDLFSPICPKGIGVLNGTEQRIDGLIPLFTEGHLRRFIEDKTGHKIEISYYVETGYDVYVTYYNHYVNLGQDLLQAYWKVATEIAEEKL